jgi:hypothetical protein
MTPITRFEAAKMKNPVMRLLGGSLILGLLIACGDGGGGKSDSGSSNSSAKSSPGDCDSYQTFLSGTAVVSGCTSTWAQNGKVPVDGNPFEKWIKLKYVIKSSSSGDGSFQAYANDKLLINKARVTLPNPYAYISLKLGIYNSSTSTVSKPWSTQIIYFDAFSTSVQNF